MSNDFSDYYGSVAECNDSKLFDELDKHLGTNWELTERVYISSKIKRV